ncbi:hypothetical protein ABEB36_000873 [Hypothenemus hampei]|uniref:Uncharacterized protein n=1 Tax=Hypothenemus hampei TaxID=57062 RepID=A0ABD1FFD3_HYPHA
MSKLCTFIFASVFFHVKCLAISQPLYENAQYLATQNVPTITYKPQQLHYKPAGQSIRADGLQYYATQQQQQQQQQQQERQQPAQPVQQKSPPSIQTPGYGPVRQVFVPTSQGPRQIDPSYYEQLLKVQQQAPQPQQVKYVPQQQYSAKYQQAQPQRPLKQRGEDEEEDDQEGDYDPNPSYQFGFDVKDDQFTNYQTRKEERDGKKITGSYSVVDADGYIRTVKYTADPKEGFKAEVSREPTDIKIKIPKPVPQYQTLPRQYPQQLQAARAHQPQYIQVGTQRVAQRGQEDENVVYQYQ